MKKRWVARPVSHLHINSIPDNAGIPESLALLLARRGYSGEDLKRYLEPRLIMLSPWESICGIREAVDRIVRAVEDSERILVHGDFDADGITATALLCRALGMLGADVEYFIPDRFKDGYGIGDSSVDACIENKTDLMITVDCGITAVAHVDTLNRAGIDTVITDHHQPGDRLPEAVAVVDPALDDSTGQADLAGVGVCWMVICGVFETMGQDTSLLLEMLQLAAIGTVTDVVELTGDNRVLVSEGLKELRSRPLPGIAALAYSASVDIGSCGSEDLAFYLGPRLNACGRVGHAGVAVDLLLARDHGEAQGLIAEVESNNRLRKRLEKDVVARAEMEAVKLPDPRCMVIAGEGWHQGVIGIVASRLTGRYGVPVVLVAVEDDIGRGSARSIPGIPIYSLLESIQAETGILTSFGGHPMAAGLTLSRKNIPLLEEELSRILSDEKWDKHLGSVIYLDGNLEELDYSMSMVNALKIMEPFGQGNRMPVWLARGAYPVSWKAVGKNRNHLKCVFRIGSENYRAIGFNMVNMQSLFNSSVDLAFTLSEDSWRNDGSIQLILKDIRKERIQAGS